MNLLLFERHELQGSRLTLQAGDRRALHVREILGLDAGDTVRVGMVNGPMGRGRVLASGRTGLELEVSLTGPPVSGPGPILILALPRPIMLQRILKQATVLGAGQIHLIRSSRVQKSFFQTHALQPAAVRKLLVQGLEQAVATRLPEVHIHTRFKPFVEDVLPGVASACRLLAHPGAESTLADLHETVRTGDRPVLAIGPEGGWIDYEVEQFTGRGFRKFSMGSRILHVDTAVVALLAQLQVLRQLPGDG